jgi:hypothetical protein
MSRKIGSNFLFGDYTFYGVVELSKDYTMISGPKILLEVVLLIWIIIALKKEGWKIANNKFLYLFTLTSLLLNTVFYIFGAWPLYSSFGEQQGITNRLLYIFVIFDILKWTILVYFITRFVIKIENTIAGGGFIITQKKYSILKTIPIGIVTGILAVIAIYGITYLLFKDGLFDRLKEMKESNLYLALGFWGGIRNLIGEEVLARLGVQTLILYYFRKKSYGTIISIILSSLYFEFWHNGFREIYFLNFSGSLVFAITYHKYGYESAAIGHCVADWLALCIAPYLLV